MLTTILMMVLSYVLYVLASFCITIFLDCIFDLDLEENIQLYIFLGVIYTIYDLITTKIKNKNEDRLEEKQQEIKRLNNRIYDLICYENDSFRDIEYKYNFIYNIKCEKYNDYKDLENKRQRIIDKCYSILYRIIKINRYADGYEDEVIKAINDTYDALKEIDEEYKDRENKVEEKLKKINKEKLKQELEELNQLKKNETEYFKYGNGEK